MKIYKAASPRSAWPATSLLLLLLPIVAAGRTSLARAGEAESDSHSYVACEFPIYGPQVGLIDGQPLINGPTGLCFVQGERAAPKQKGLCLFRPALSVTVGVALRTAEGVKVHAEGTTTTAGWQYATLAERERSVDGSRVTLELRACPPTGFAADVVSLIAAEAILQTLDPQRPIRSIEILSGSSRLQLAVGE